MTGRRGGFAASFFNNNRSKKSVTLNLKDPRGVAAALWVRETADVFVQNFRPGVAERIGLGESAVRGAQRDVIYTSIAGFGSTGDWARWPVYKVPCAPVLTRDRVWSHPQVQANDAVIELDHPQADRVRQTRPPTRFSATPTDLSGSAPRLGANTAAVVLQVGYDAKTVDDMIAKCIATNVQDAAP